MFQFSEKFSLTIVYTFLDLCLYIIIVDLCLNESSHIDSRTGVLTFTRQSHGSSRTVLPSELHISVASLSFRHLFVYLQQRRVQCRVASKCVQMSRILSGKKLYHFCKFSTFPVFSLFYVYQQYVFHFAAVFNQIKALIPRREIYERSRVRSRSVTHKSFASYVGTS